MRSLSKIIGLYGLGWVGFIDAKTAWEKIRPISDCMNPSTYNKNLFHQEICSGLGVCQNYNTGYDRCQCYQFNNDNGEWSVVDGEKDFNGNQVYGKWCQCNTWDCVKKPYNGSYRIGSSTFCMAHRLLDSDSKAQKIGLRRNLTRSVFLVGVKLS